MSAQSGGDGADGGAPTPSDPLGRDIRRPTVQSPTPGRVLGLVGIMLVLAVAVLGWPFIQQGLATHSAPKAFRPADDATQAAIVRAWLTDSRYGARAVYDRHPDDGPMYFDARSAMFCALDHADACDAFEYLAVGEREGALVDPADHSVPMELQSLLDRLTTERTVNVDPQVPGVTLLAGNGVERIMQECTAHPGRPIPVVRISRAAVQEPEGIALALALTRYCDRSIGMYVVRFQRTDRGWIVRDVR